MALNVDQMLRQKAYDQLARAGVEAGNVSDIRQITIDGNTIVGYNKHYFFREKTYSQEPQRSLGGVIDNLNSYVTFVTPKVKLHFNALSISDYRMIMKLIMAKNEFTVTCWDSIYNEQVTFRAYFYPQDYPEIYQYDAEVLAVMDYEIELIGTNAKDNMVNIIYHTNPPAGFGDDSTSASKQYYINERAIVGEGKTDITESKEYDGYRFDRWLSLDGVYYTNGDEIQMTGELVLYAQWTSTGTYTLSYDYGDGEEGETKSKEIKVGDAIGTLPSTDGKKVTVDNQEYEVYTNGGWYYGTSKTSKKVSESDAYEVLGNTTIHQLFVTKVFAVQFVSPAYGDIGAGNVTKYLLPYGTTDIQSPAYDYVPDDVTLEWYDGTGEDAHKVTTFTVKPYTTTYYGRVKVE